MKKRTNSVVNMPPILFSKEMEMNLLLFYEHVWARASGSTVTLKASEKYALVAEKLNALGKKDGWKEVRAANVETKTDTLQRMGREGVW